MAHPILSITMKDAHEAIVHAARITDNLWIIQFVLPGVGDVNLYFRSADDAIDLLVRALRALVIAQAYHPMKSLITEHTTNHETP